jgi:hypothetical protein
MRFRDFLRTAVLLYGGAATALAAVAVIGAGRNDDSTLVFIALAWWLLAAISGLWMGRGATTTPGIAGLLADARRANTLPEFEPGTILFNRLWPLVVLAVAAGALGFFFPPVPAVAVGYALLVALLWRKQSSAVEAIEGRDGVEFWIDRTSPFGPPRLLRLPGMRKIEPEDEAPVSP